MSNVAAGRHKLDFCKPKYSLLDEPRRRKPHPKTKRHNTMAPHLGYPLFVFFVFLYSSLAVPMRPLDRSQRLMAHMTRFRPRKCLLGVSMTKNNVWGSKPPKNVNFGGGNRRFEPNLQNFQMPISQAVVMRLTWNFNTMFGPRSRLRGWSMVTK